MITLTKPRARLEVQTINSNHPGADFGVIVLNETDAQFSLRECLAFLAADGWSTPQEVPSAQDGVHKFLLSRKK